MDRKIFTIYGTDASDMTKALLEAGHVAERIGKKDARIVLKPNLVVAKTPDSGATTHGGVLRGAIEYLQSRGFSDICILEGSWVGDSTSRAMRLCGYDEISKACGVPFYDGKREETVKVRTEVGEMPVCRRALEADAIVNMPVLKGHCQTVMTCALKNCKGFLPDSEKRRFHAQGLMRPIAALGAVLRPAFNLVDSICGDLNFEEGGTPVQTNRMLLGFDPVQVDTYGCRLMGIDPRDVGYIPLAEQFGAGSMEVRPEDLVFLNGPGDVRASYPPPSGMVKKLSRNVEQRSACSACFGNLVRALYRINEEGGECSVPIAIGQGFRGVSFSGVGIGRCCDCAGRQVKGCPPDADAILRELTR